MLDLDPAIFAVVRSAPDGSERVLCLHNVTGAPVEIAPDRVAQGLPDGATWRDVLTGQEFSTSSAGLTPALAPYQVVWLISEVV